MKYPLQKNCPEDNVMRDSSSNLEYVVTNAALQAVCGKRRQYKISKVDLQSQKYELYHVGWANKPDMSAVTIKVLQSSEYSCQEFALNLAFQISSSKLYTYFSSMAMLRRHLMIGYVLLILFAQYDNYGVQLQSTLFFFLPLESTALLTFIAAVEMLWLHLGTQGEEITYEKITDWLKMVYSYIVKVYNLGTTKGLIQETVSVDLAQKPETCGSKVVESVVERISRSRIFKNDYGYVRRISFVETKDGLDALTFRSNYHGGLWQVDEVMFKRTKNTDAHPELIDLHRKIEAEFNINWPSIQWKDLRKPLHCALAVQQYMETLNTKIPSSIQEQGNHWNEYYKGGKMEPTIFNQGTKELNLQILNAEGM